jgi:hypothetical protein
MEFPELREAVKSRGVKGRDRQLMTRQYLAATGQDANAISKEKLVPKGGLVEEETSTEDTPSSEGSESKVEEKEE